MEGVFEVRRWDDIYIYISGFIKFGSGIQKLIMGDSQTTWWSHKPAEDESMGKELNLKHLHLNHWLVWLAINTCRVSLGSRTVHFFTCGVFPPVWVWCTKMNIIGGGQGWNCAAYTKEKNFKSIFPGGGGYPRLSAVSNEIFNDTGAGGCVYRA
jgi:hypothetical protein